MGACLSSSNAAGGDDATGTVHLAAGPHSSRQLPRQGSSANTGGLGIDGGPSMSSVGLGSNARTDRDRSHAIDRQIEEDSRKYRKECKILLLGPLARPRAISDAPRLRRERQVDHRQADEDHPSCVGGMVRSI